MPFSSQAFAQFLASTAAVRFGEFTLKSGRKSNVFFDLGRIVRGEELLALGGFYADFIVEKGLHDAEALFGPAYKGINIAIATSIALHQRHGVSLPFVYNRKAEKGHGESGRFVGVDLASCRSVIILDDVFTDGGTKYEALELLSRFSGLVIRAVIIGVDRQEVDESGRTYLSLFREQTSLEVYALTTKEEVLALRR